MSEALIIIFSFMSSLTSFSLQKKRSFDAVRSSCFSTLLFSCIAYVLSYFTEVDFNHVLKVIFGASFIGMCSPVRFSFKEVVLNNFLFLVLFYFVLDKLPYSGGALGFLVFLSFGPIVIYKNLKWRLR